MVDVRHGDLLLKDPHQQHCNTSITPLTGDYTRLAFVLYYREKMQKCVPKKKIKIKKRSKEELVRYRFPNRGIDLELSIRPGTTDEKVVTEVLKNNVYEKNTISFKVTENDRWLDLGGNIGTFALLALNHGATVVSCEPEPDNLRLLEKNLRHNFPDDKRWQIIPAAVTPRTENTIDLYLCKGDYNKYRHTIYHKRGRSSIKVPNIHIRELLQKESFNAIKMDIEGAEIDILETLQPEDYKGIEKMVFEYSFDIDPSIPRFLAIIKRLREVFHTVHYTKVKDDELEYRYFPAATLVFCAGARH